MTRISGLDGWGIVAIGIALALVGVGAAAGTASAEHVDYKQQDADVQAKFLGTGTYYVGQDIFIANTCTFSPDRVVLVTAKGTASLSQGVNVSLYQRKQHVDEDCDAIVDTSGMEPGLYQIYWEIDTAAGTIGKTGPTVVHTIRLKKPRVVEAPDDADGSGDGGDDQQQDGSTTSDGDGQSGSDDYVGVVTPPEMPEFDQPDFTAPDVNWSRLAPAAIVVEDAVGKPGETVEVNVRVTNTANETNGYIVDFPTMPSGLTIEGHDDAGGTWKQDRWLFASIDSGSVVQPNLTVRIPNGSGVTNYTIEGAVNTQNRVVATDTGTVTAISNASLCQAIAGTDGVISDSEVLRAVNAWNDDEPVPAVGVKVTDEQILAIIEAWRDGTICGDIPLPGLTVPSGGVPQQPPTGGAMPGS